jgi:hypothetical protein
MIMETKYDIGQKVTFVGTISKIEIYQDNVTLYYLADWNGIPFSEEKITEYSIDRKDQVNDD